MTFKLTMGDKIVRDERAPSTKTASDLVRDFRSRLRAEAQSAQAPKRGPAEVARLDRSRNPRLPRS
jgi:hypothetical protein